MTTLCLTMAVKNAALELDHCLDSVLPHVHTWVILDGGSTDGTQDLIRQRLGHLPGELVEEAWTDPDGARTEALARARGRADYALLLEAEDILLCPQGFAFPPLAAAAYAMPYRITTKEPCPGGFRTTLLSRALPWRFREGAPVPAAPDWKAVPVPLEDPSVLAPCASCSQDLLSCRGWERLLEAAVAEAGRTQAGPDPEGVRACLATLARRPSGPGPLQELARFLRARSLTSR